MTQAELFNAVRRLGLTIRRTGFGSEVRIAYRLGPRYNRERRAKAEACAYYTDNWTDALATARLMAAEPRPF